MKKIHFEFQKLLITLVTAAVIILLVSVPLFIIPDMKNASASNPDGATAAAADTSSADHSAESVSGSEITTSAEGAAAEALMTTSNDDDRRETAGGTGSGGADADSGSQAANPETDNEDWALLLVNAEHTLPEDFTIETISLDSGIFVGHTLEDNLYYIDTRCYAALEELMTACIDAGNTPVISSGYRSHETQVELYQNQIAFMLELGLSEEEAIAEAGTVVALPGTSEHELGLAVDIASEDNLDLDETQADTVTQQWLIENSWKYGFVLRYPEDKADITGIIYEPWHYRYVGVSAATEMHEQNLCLEEYVAIHAETDSEADFETDTAS